MHQLLPEKSNSRIPVTAPTSRLSTQERCTSTVQLRYPLISSLDPRPSFDSVGHVFKAESFLSVIPLRTAFNNLNTVNSGNKPLRSGYETRLWYRKYSAPYSAAHAIAPVVNASGMGWRDMRM